MEARADYRASADEDFAKDVEEGRAAWRNQFVRDPWDEATDFEGAVGRDIREAIAIAQAIEAQPGYERQCDETFADDLEEGMKLGRREFLADVWND